MAPFPIDLLSPRQGPYLLTTQTIIAATTTYTTTYLQTASPTTTTAGVVIPTTTSSQATTTTIAPSPTSDGPSSAVVGGAIIGSVLGLLILAVWWCYCGCYLSCFGVECFRRRKPRWGSSTRSSSDYTSDSSPSSGTTQRVRVRVDRRGGGIQVPRRAVMRERRSSVGTRESRVVYETRRRSGSSRRSYERRKEPLFPWFSPRY